MKMFTEQKLCISVIYSDSLQHHLSTTGIRRKTQKKKSHYPFSPIFPLYISFYLLIFKVIIHISFFATRSSTHSSVLHKDIPVTSGIQYTLNVYSLGYAGDLTG